MDVLLCCQGYVTSSKQEMSELAAELYAIVCVECRDASVDLVSVINDLLADTYSKVFWSTEMYYKHHRGSPPLHWTTSEL